MPMRTRKVRRLWPITFAVLAVGMILTFSILLGFFLRAVRTIGTQRIRDRNLTTLALSEAFIESTINEIVLDLDLLLMSIEGMSEEEAARRLGAFLEQHPLWTLIHVADRDGRILFSVPDFPDLDGIDISGMGYFKAWQEVGGTTFYDLESTMVSHEPLPSAIGSLGDTVLVGHIDLSSLARELLSRIEGDDVSLCLHDSRGTFLIHPNLQMVRDQTRNPFTEEIAEAYDSGVLEVALDDGKDRIHAQVTELGDLGWFLGVYQNETAMDRESFGSLVGLIPALASLVLLLLVHAMTASRLVARPFIRIAKQIEANVGTTGFRFRAMGYRETDDVMKAMNRLMAALEEQAEDLKKTRDRAEAANRTKDLFLANMSHELLTPLNGILGATALLKDVNVGSEGARLLALQESSVNQLQGLIMDILDYSRLREGDLGLNVIRFRPVPLIEETLGPYIAEAKEKNLEFITTFKMDPAFTVTTDPERLKQIIKHLVANAVKFTDEGGIEVELAVEGQNGEGSMIHLTIRDTGRGMPRSEIRTLLGRFTQGEETYTKTFRGAGMGLALVESLAELLGGSLSIDSEPYAGTTATVSLPKILSRGGT